MSHSKIVQRKEIKQSLLLSDICLWIGNMQAVPTWIYTNRFTAMAAAVSGLACLVLLSKRARLIRKSVIFSCAPTACAFFPCHCTRPPFKVLSLPSPSFLRALPVVPDRPWHLCVCLTPGAIGQLDETKPGILTFPVMCSCRHGGVCVHCG